MNVKLSALALGITLAYGVTAAMAAEATIDQSGGMSTATINQYANEGTEVEASIVTSGWNNTHIIDQTRSDRIWAEINAPGSFNTASIQQHDLNYGGATVYQRASNSRATVQQGVSNDVVTMAANRGGGKGNGGGKGHGGGNGHGNGNGNGGNSNGNGGGNNARDYGSSQWAFIYQNQGWGHDANIVQAGHMVEATITQAGFNNTAEVYQTGAGQFMNEANVSQRGTNLYANVNQNGYDLIATVNQRGVGNQAYVEMTGNGHRASVTQNGWGNTAYVNQSN